MAPLSQLRSPYRGFHIGFPGSGKTGSLISLARAGFKLRILDYTGNFLPLQVYYEDGMDIDIVQLQDRLIDNGQFAMPDGVPTAFTTGLTLLKEWKYKNPDGSETNLGKSAEWGQDTIVVVDELTSLAKMSMNRAMVMNNCTPKSMTSAVWGMGVKGVSDQISVMKTKPHHTIINCHKQLLGAQDFTMQSGRNEDQKAVATLVNQEIQEMKDAGLIQPRYYPVGVTKNSSQTIHGELPIMLEFEQVTKMGKEMRIIKTTGSSIIDVKIPGAKLKKEYGIENGLAEIFADMGYQAPKR